MIFDIEDPNIPLAALDHWRALTIKSREATCISTVLAPAKDNSLNPIRPSSPLFSLHTEALSLSTISSRTLTYLYQDDAKRAPSVQPDCWGSLSYRQSSFCTSTRKLPDSLQGLLDILQNTPECSLNLSKAFPANCAINRLPVLPMMFKG